MGKTSFEYMPDAALLADLAQPFPMQRSFLPNGSVAFVESTQNHVLANPALPINRDRDRIADLMESGQSFAVAAPTGSGKTLELPRVALALQKRKYDNIYQTQPTILGARSAHARQVTELNGMNADGIQLVGYQAATEGISNDKNVIHIMTDQLLAEKAMSGQIGPNDLVILDEFHMRKLGTDIALTLCHQLGVQVVISSATIDLPYISRRVEEMTGKRFPTITGEGRRYPIEERVSDVDTSQTIVDFVDELKKSGVDSPKVGTILPGDASIREIKGMIQSRLPKNMQIFRLTSESSRAHHARAIASHEGGSVILGTNIMETSVTIPDMHGLIDPGWQRVGRWQDGVKNLPLVPASRAARDQRKGRVGRTMAGVYFRAQLDGYPPLALSLDGENAADVVRRRVPQVILRDTTPDYELSEIETIDLSGIQLRLKARGMSLDTLSLITEPSRHGVAEADHRLRQIDAMTFGEKEITDIGKEMVKLNLDTEYARMVVEALKYGERVTLQMITAVSALQVKGVGSTGMNNRQWLELTKEKRSDLLAQLDVVLASLNMSDKERATFSIIDHRVEHAVTLAKTLAERVGLDFDRVAPPTEYEREKLLKCSIKGYHTVFVRKGKRTFKDKNGDSRIITGNSIISTRAHLAELIMGEAIDIGYKSPRHGLKMRRAVKMATAVTMTILNETVPEKISRKLTGYDMTKTGRIFGVQAVYFENMHIGTGRKYQIQPTEETDHILVMALCTKQRVEGNYPLIKELHAALDDLQSLQSRTDKNLGLDGVHEYLAAVLNQRTPKSVMSISGLAEVITPNDIKGYVPAELRAEIMRLSPDDIELVLSDGEKGKFEVTYRNNVANIHVLPQQVLLLPDEISVLGRKTLIKVQGCRNYLTIAQAKEHFGRESRWYRRGGASGLSKNVHAAMTAEGHDAETIRNMVSITAVAETVVIVNHFHPKNPGKKRR
jgi:HrpA-like RNA helicase